MDVSARARANPRYQRMLWEERARQDVVPISETEKRIADQVVKDAGAFGFGAAALFAGAVAAVRLLEKEKLP